MLRVVRRVVIGSSELQIHVDIAALNAHMLQKGPETFSGQDDDWQSVAHQAILTAPVAIIRHRAELRFVEPGAYVAIDKPNSSLLRVMVRVQRWKRRILNAEIHSRRSRSCQRNKSECKLHWPNVQELPR